MEQSAFEWIALTPERVEGDQAPMFADLIRAFVDFKTDKEKGHGSAEWLTEHALDGWPDFVTWVCRELGSRRIEGHFTVGKTRLGPGDLGDVPFDAHLAPTSEIKNLRRRAYAMLTEEELLEEAALTAVEGWREVGAAQVPVVLDPVGAQLCREHDFWRRCSDNQRLWHRFPVGGSGADSGRSEA